MADLKRIIQLVEAAFSEIDAPSWDAKYSMADAMVAAAMDRFPPSGAELAALAKEADRLAKIDGLDRDALLEWFQTAFKSAVPPP